MPNPNNQNDPKKSAPLDQSGRTQGTPPGQQGALGATGEVQGTSPGQQSALSALGALSTLDLQIVRFWSFANTISSCILDATQPKAIASNLPSLLKEDLKHLLKRTRGYIDDIIISGELDFRVEGELVEQSRMNSISFLEFLKDIFIGQIAGRTHEELEPEEQIYALHIERALYLIDNTENVSEEAVAVLQAHGMASSFPISFLTSHPILLEETRYRLLSFVQWLEKRITDTQRYLPFYPRSDHSLDGGGAEGKRPGSADRPGDPRVQAGLAALSYGSSAPRTITTDVTRGTGSISAATLKVAEAYDLPDDDDDLPTEQPPRRHVLSIVESVLDSKLRNGESWISEKETTATTTSSITHSTSSTTGTEVIDWHHPKKGDGSPDGRDGKGPGDDGRPPKKDDGRPGGKGPGDVPKKGDDHPDGKGPGDVPKKDDGRPGGKGPGDVPKKGDGSPDGRDGKGPGDDGRPPKKDDGHPDGKGPGDTSEGYSELLATLFSVAVYKRRKAKDAVLEATNMLLSANLQLQRAKETLEKALNAEKEAKSAFPDDKNAQKNAEKAVQTAIAARKMAEKAVRVVVQAKLKAKQTLKKAEKAKQEAQRRLEAEPIPGTPHPLRPRVHLLFPELFLDVRNVLRVSSGIPVRISPHRRDILSWAFGIPITSGTTEVTPGAVAAICARSYTATRKKDEAEEEKEERKRELDDLGARSKVSSAKVTTKSDTTESPSRPSFKEKMQSFAESVFSLRKRAITNIKNTFHKGGAEKPPKEKYSKDLKPEYYDELISCRDIADRWCYDSPYFNILVNQACNKGLSRNALSGFFHLHESTISQRIPCVLRLETFIYLMQARKYWTLVFILQHCTVRSKEDLQYMMNAWSHMCKLRIIEACSSGVSLNTILNDPDGSFSAMIDVMGTLIVRCNTDPDGLYDLHGCDISEVFATMLQIRPTIAHKLLKDRCYNYVFDEQKFSDFCDEKTKEAKRKKLGALWTTLKVILSLFFLLSYMTFIVPILCIVKLAFKESSCCFPKAEQPVQPLLLQPPHVVQAVLEAFLLQEEDSENLNHCNQDMEKEENTEAESEVDELFDSVSSEEEDPNSSVDSATVEGSEKEKGLQ